MKYLLHLPEIPFLAIKNGTKKVEGRVFRHTTPYQNMKAGDRITFENETTHESMDTEVLFIHHYPDVRSMLEKEGIKNVLSSGDTIEDGIEKYNSFTHYKENIPLFGIYAIGISHTKKY
jgi:ASC-1-like (ASCH) protein